MTIPTEQELRAGAKASYEIDQDTAMKIRRLTLGTLRRTSERTTEHIRHKAKSADEIQGAVVDAIATGIEIGIHIGEARGKRAAAALVDAMDAGKQTAKSGPSPQFEEPESERGRR